MLRIVNYERFATKGGRIDLRVLIEISKAQRKGVASDIFEVIGKQVVLRGIEERAINGGT